MKKCFIAIILSVGLSCISCASNETTEQKSVTEYTAEGLSELADKNNELLERTNTLKEITQKSLSSTSSEWLVSNESAITTLAQEEDVYVSVKVTIPQIIPRVADDICQPLVDAIKNMGYEQYEISILHTSNLANEKSSGASWKTEDGVTGLFADNESEKVVFQSGVSIDDLYSYYDNFGLEENDNESD